MIKSNPSKSIRAAAAFTVAAVLAGAASASAQNIGTNIFGGTNAPNPDSLSVAALVSTNNQNTGPLGPGFMGTVNIGVGAGTVLTESINVDGNGTLTAVESGLAGVAASFSATKTFTAATFVPNQYYRFTLTTTTNAALSLLSNAQIILSTTSNGVTSPVVDTTDPNGLLGLVNVIGLFGNTNTATITFRAPATVDPTAPITVTVEGGLLASSLGNPNAAIRAYAQPDATGSTFAFTGASLQAVPEPGSTATVCLGMLGAALIAFRRRTA